jgi:RNA polymerase sigma-70 factor (ECF subfamily)
MPPNGQSGVTSSDQAQRDEGVPTTAVAEPPRPDGDYTAFFRAHHPYVWCSLRRLGVREADLEDNVHEVFLAIYRRRQDYDPRLPVRPWIFAFALRRASDHRRGAWQRHRAVALDDDLRSEAPRPDDTAAAREERAMVLEALDDLTLEHRAVFVLHEIDGSAIPAVAGALEIPLNTAYSRLRAARESFATAWRRLLVRRGER